MEIKEAIEILRSHNEWRRGAPVLMETPAKLGEAIDTVVQFHSVHVKEVVGRLNEAFLPQNVECDGGACMGCWKDVVRDAIKMINNE